MVIQVPARVYYALFRLLRLFILRCTGKGGVAEGEGAQQMPSGGTRARPAVLAVAVRAGVDDGLGAVEAFGARSCPGMCRRGGKGGRRVTSGCAPTPACTGNGAIASLRDGRGAEPGVKDTRRPPF